MTLSDPLILTASLIAVAFVGLSKGGLGGAFGLLGVPIMALFIPPLQAAALLLPIYLLMDAVSLWTWRGQWDKHILWQMVPAGLYWHIYRLADSINCIGRRRKASGWACGSGFCCHDSYKSQI